MAKRTVVAEAECRQYWRRRVPIVKHSNCNPSSQLKKRSLFDITRGYNRVVHRMGTRPAPVLTAFGFRRRRFFSPYYVQLADRTQRSAGADRGCLIQAASPEEHAFAAESISACRTGAPHFCPSRFSMPRRRPELTACLTPMAQAPYTSDTSFHYEFAPTMCGQGERWLRPLGTTSLFARPEICDDVRCSSCWQLITFLRTQRYDPGGKLVIRCDDIETQARSSMPSRVNCISR